MSVAYAGIPSEIIFTHNATACSGIVEKFNLLTIP
jgi:hypothetical protein